MSVRRVPILVCLLGVLSAGCGGDTGREDLLALLDAGQYDDVEARVAELRADGMLAPWLDYAEGVVAFRQGREELARRRLQDAAAADAAFVSPASELLDAAARVDYEAGHRERARARMATAILIDPTIDPEPMLDSAADYLFRFERNYEAARPLYHRLYTERPEPASRHTQWVFRYGYTLEMADDDEGARAIYEEYLETWPEEMQIGARVTRRYMDLLIKKAQSVGAAGDVDEALALVKMTKLGGWHMDRQQRAEFVAGEVCEQAGRYDEARVHFARVLEYAPRVQSEFYDLATARLEALDARGSN